MGESASEGRGEEGELTWAGVGSCGRDTATWGDEWPWGVVGVSLGVGVGESVLEGRGEEGALTWVGG